MLFALFIVLASVAPLARLWATGGPVVQEWLLGVNMVVFVLYGFDKRAAQVGRGRLSEKLLHLLALAGGAPGAAVARELFRHKTAKPQFGVMLLVAVGCIWAAAIATNFQ